MSELRIPRSVRAMIALVSAALTAGAADQVQAVVLAYEGFNYAPAKIVDMNGDGVTDDGLGTAGNGWAGPWDNVQGVTPDDSAVVAGSLSYKDALGNTLTTTGGKLLNTGSAGNSQPGRTLSSRRDGAALGATATTPVATWLSFLANRIGPVNGESSPPIRTGTYARGANFTLFDTELGSAPNEEKLNLGENSNFQYPFTTGTDFIRLQQTDPSLIETLKQKYGKPSELAMTGYDVWMMQAPRVNASITAQAAPNYIDPVDGEITAAIDWHVSPVGGQFRQPMTTDSFGGGVDLMVIRIDHFGGDAPRDKVTMWMNPNLNAAPADNTADAVLDLAAIETRATETAQTAFNTATGHLFSFDRLRLFAGNEASPTFAAEWDLDEIRLGTTFADVTPHTGPVAAAGAVPEPASLALAGLAIAALVGARRR